MINFHIRGIFFSNASLIRWPLPSVKLFNDRPSIQCKFSNRKKEMTSLNELNELKFCHGDKRTRIKKFKSLHVEGCCDIFIAIELFATPTRIVIELWHYRL